MIHFLFFIVATMLTLLLLLFFFILRSIKDDYDEVSGEKYGYENHF